MKKLMIAAVAVFAAVAANAAAANWKASASEIKDGKGETAGYYVGTAYIFDADVKSQSALYDMIVAGTATDLTKVGGYMTSVALTAESEGYFGNVTFANGEQGDGKYYNYYFVCLKDDSVYFSTEKSLKPNGTASAKTVGFGTQTNSALAPTSGYEAAGKWAAVPEPTSAMLLLLGVAGLALRRKQK